MNILVVTYSDEEVGGVASTVRNLAKYLRRQDHDVFFFHPGAAILLKQKTTKLGFACFNLRLQMPIEERHAFVGICAFVVLFPILLAQIIYLVLKQKIDVINIHYPVDRFVYFALCRRICRITLITSVHGADLFPVGQVMRHSSRSFKYLLDSSDWIVAPSQQFQKDLLTAFPEWCSKATFIHNGVNLAELQGLGSNEMPHLGTPYVLCISGYKEQKAIDVLVRAFVQVHANNPSIRLIIAGGGHLRSQLESLAVSLAINEQIEFLGPVGHAEVMGLIRACEVFVLPSRFETFGIAILEAMAEEKPVIATAVGGIPEIIENGKNGILVPPDDPSMLAEAISAVFRNVEMKYFLAREGRITVHNRFRFERTGSAYEALFRGSTKIRCRHTAQS